MLYNLYKHWCNAEVVRGGLRHISRDGRSSLNISTWVMSQALRYKSFGTSDLLPLATHLGLVNKPLMLEEKDPQSVFMTVMRARGGADAAVQLKAEESSNASINRVERFYMNLTMYIKRGASKACLRLALAARWRACGAPGERRLRRRGDPQGESQPSWGRGGQLRAGPKPPCGNEVVLCGKPHAWGAAFSSIYPRGRAQATAGGPAPSDGECPRPGGGHERQGEAHEDG